MVAAAKEPKEAKKKASSKPVIACGGGKGGVGKSLMAAALTDHLLRQGEKVFLVETDTTAPDVYESYKDVVSGSELVNLKDREEWIRLATILSQSLDSTVVINTAGGTDDIVKEHGQMLSRAVKALDRKLIAVFMLSRARESLELLVNFTETMPDAHMRVIRNLYYGAERKYELYNNSNLKKELEKRGGRTINFPEVADRVTDAMNRERLTITKALEELPFGDRMELESWRDGCQPVFAEILR